MVVLKAVVNVFLHIEILIDEYFSIETNELTLFNLAE